MQKRTRDRWLVNLSLLVIISLLVSFVLLDEPDSVTSAETLADSLPDKITEILISRAGKKNIHFKFTNDHWVMLEPYQTRAEDSLINRLLALSALEVSTLNNSQNIKLASFGLEKPQVSIQLNQHTINFGDIQPIGQRRYITLGEKVLLIADQHLAQLKASSISYIDRHLIPQDMQLSGLRIGDQIFDIEKPNTQLRTWSTTKANWISLAAESQDTLGIDITIQFSNPDQTINYIAQQRESDIVLINMQSKLEYHFFAESAKALGLNLQATEE